MNFTPAEGEVQSKESSGVDEQSEDEEPSMQTLVRVLLETGRKHQIRAQLAHIGEWVSQVAALRSDRLRHLSSPLHDHSYGVTLRSLCVWQIAKVNTVLRYTQLSVD